jgi:phage regulator Rha-like protein
MRDDPRVRLRPEELAERAQQLAGAVRALQLLEDEHAEERQAMAAAKRSAQKRVHELAEVVRTGIEQADLFQADGRGGG